MARELHAWADESMRVGSDDVDGHYVLASVLCETTSTDAVRATLRSLLAGRAPRLHWRDEDHRRRTIIASTIAALDVEGIVVVGAPMTQRKQERARRICMEALLPILEERGVTRLHVEARTPSLMAKDRQHLLTMIGKRLIGPGLRVENARPLEEPMLWAPDAIAGAVNAARSGQPQWLDLIRHDVHEIDVKIR